MHNGSKVKHFSKSHLSKTPPILHIYFEKHLLLLVRGLQINYNFGLFIHRTNKK